MLSTKAIRLKSKREAKKMIEAAYNEVGCSSSNKKFKIEETSNCNDVEEDSCSKEKVESEKFIDQSETSSDCHNLSVESMEEVNIPINDSLKEKIRLWAVKHGLTTTVVNELLDILRDNDIQVPKDKGR